MTGSVVSDKTRKQARTAFKAGLYEEAVTHYARLLPPVDRPAASSNANVRDRSDFATALFRCGRYADAERELQAVLQIDSGSASAHHKLGLVSMRLGKPQQALEAFRTAAQLAPQEPAYQWAYAEVALAVGEREEAEAAIEASLAVDPNNEEAKAAKSALAARPEAFRTSLPAQEVADEQFAGLVDFIKSRPVDDPPAVHHVDTGYSSLIGVTLGSLAYLLVYLYVRVVLIG